MKKKLYKLFVRCFNSNDFWLFIIYFLSMSYFLCYYDIDFSVAYSSCYGASLALCGGHLFKFLRGNDNFLLDQAEEK